MLHVSTREIKECCLRDCMFSCNQGLVSGEPELAHECDFDVENIIAKKRKFEYARWKNPSS